MTTEQEPEKPDVNLLAAEWARTIDHILANGTVDDEDLQHLEAFSHALDAFLGEPGGNES